MHSRLAVCVLAALTVPTMAIAQLPPAPLSAPELGGSWTLTFKPNPPGSGGPQVTMKDKSGRTLQSLAFILTVQTSGSRVAGCQLRGADDAAAEAAPCRLERGALVVRMTMSGSGGGGGGAMVLRLARTASGAIAGPVRVRAPIIPIGLPLGVATLARGS